jgi:hypothetical protein
VKQAVLTGVEGNDDGRTFSLSGMRHKAQDGLFESTAGDLSSLLSRV